MQKIAFLTAALIGAASFTPAIAEDVTGKSAISAEISTTGVGVDYIYGISPNLHLRASVNGGKISYEFEGEDNNGTEGDELKYEGDLNLFSIGGTADWYPNAGGFRVSAGLFFNDNNLSGSARCENPSGCEFGEADNNQRFLPGELGEVFADVTFNPIAPYIGIGYGNPLNKTGWGFSGDLGLLIQGSADVELRSDGDCSATALQVDCTAERDAALEDEEREIEEDVKALKAYPVLNFALTYRF